MAGTLNLAALNKAENLKTAFESFDIDGDGKITREELQAGLKVGAHVISVSPHMEAVFASHPVCADIGIGAMLLQLTACHAEFCVPELLRAAP